MRILLISGLLILGGTAIQAQPSHLREQDDFGLESEILHPVTLTDAELNALAGTELMKRELDRDPPIARLTREGLVASVVHLGGDEERDLLVVGSGRPFIGANVGPFWVIRDLPAGPRVVFSTIALGVSILKTSFKSLKDIESFAATAGEGTTLDFRFNGVEYVRYKEKSAPLGK